MLQMHFTHNETVFTAMDDATLIKNMSELHKLKVSTNPIKQLPRALRLCKREVNRRFLGVEEKESEQ